MHRSFLLAVATLLVATGCGTEQAATAPAGEPSSGPARTPGPRPSRSPVASSTPPTDRHGPLADVPLDLGYARENGDDHSPVVVTAEPATTAFALCGSPAWDPHHGTTDVIGVEFRGEAEWARGRTLVLYPGEDAAAAAVTAGHDAVAGCPEDEADGRGSATAHTLVDVALGDQSVGWVDRFRSADLDGHFDPGLVVYHLVRVGRAVLLSYQYDEGNATAESREREVAAALEDDRPVVDAMREPAATGRGPAS